MVERGQTDCKVFHLHNFHFHNFHFWNFIFKNSQNVVGSKGFFLNETNSLIVEADQTDVKELSFFQILL